MYGLLDCEDQLLLAAVPINRDTVGIVIPSLGKCIRCVMCRPDPNWNRTGLINCTEYVKINNNMYN